jgi:hypothetical protein
VTDPARGQNGAQQSLRSEFCCAIFGYARKLRNLDALHEYLKSGESVAVRRMDEEIVSLRRAELSEIKKIGLPNRQTQHPNRGLIIKAT